MLNAFSLTLKIYFYLLFQRVKIINDDTNEEIQRKERSAYDEDDKVEIIIERCLVLRLLINFCGINCVRHDLHPAFESCLEREFCEYRSDQPRD